MTALRSAKARAAVVAERLADAYPGSATQLCALEHRDPYELLVATILSAQCTDARVNMVTPALFAEFPDAAALAAADPERVEELIRSTGFFRSKARSLIGMASEVTGRYGGKVPVSLEDLVTLPGVGRKTANVVRSVAFGEPGLPVDTHVARLSRRLGLTKADNADRIEQDLNRLVPPADRGAFSLRLILHGRAVCTARRPQCAACMLADVCPSAHLGAPVRSRSGASSGTTPTDAASRGRRAGTVGS